jgi:hypothetical protein
MEEVPYQPASELGPADCGREQLSIAYFLYLAQSPFLFEPVDKGLHGCVSNAFILGQTVENLADRAGSQFPVLFQDSRFRFRKPHLRPPPTKRGNPTTLSVFEANEITVVRHAGNEQQNDSAGNEPSSKFFFDRQSTASDAPARRAGRV